MIIEFEVFGGDLGKRAYQIINLNSMRRIYAEPLYPGVSWYYTIVIEHFDRTKYHIGIFNTWSDANAEIEFISEAIKEGEKLYKISDGNWTTEFYYDINAGRWKLPKGYKPPEAEIEELNLSSRTYNCLHRVGVETIAQLTEWSEKRLKNIRNLGNKSCEEIVEKLSLLGLSLKQDDEDD